MQGDIVTASRWLGTSIVLASGIIVGGLIGVRPSPTPSPASPATPVQLAPLDVDVLRQSADTMTDPTRATRPVGEDFKPFERCDRTPTDEPVSDGSAPASCLDPPSEAEVWEKVPKFKTGSPVFYETQRNNVRILIEKIGERVEPCKLFPLAGACQLVHCHYKCTVTFDEANPIDSPVPSHHTRHRVDVVFIDKDHLRRCEGSFGSMTAP